jgi:hypothetical protein
MLKRLLDDKIRSRLSNAIDNEIMLRILTLNLMILLLIALQRVLNKAYTGPLTLVIEISAPRYKAARVSVRELFSQKEITIALGTNN